MALTDCPVCWNHPDICECPTGKIAIRAERDQLQAKCRELAEKNHKLSMPLHHEERPTRRENRKLRSEVERLRGSLAETRLNYVRQHADAMDAQARIDKALGLLDDHCTLIGARIIRAALKGESE